MDVFGKIRRRFGIRIIHRMDYFFLGLFLGFVLGVAIVLILFFLFFPR